MGIIKITVLCKNDFPHKAYYSAKKAEKECKRLNKLEDLAEELEYGYKRIHFHTHDIDCDVMFENE